MTTINSASGNDGHNVAKLQNSIRQHVNQVLDLEAQKKDLMERHIKPIAEQITAAKRNLKTETDIPWAHVKPTYDHLKLVRKTHEFMDEDEGADARDNIRLVFEALRPGEVLDLEDAIAATTDGSDSATSVADIYTAWRDEQSGDDDDNLHGSLYLVGVDGKYHAFNMTAKTIADTCGLTGEDYHPTQQTPDGPMAYVCLGESDIPDHLPKLHEAGWKVAIKTPQGEVALHEAA